MEDLNTTVETTEMVDTTGSGCVGSALSVGLVGFLGGLAGCAAAAGVKKLVAIVKNRKEEVVVEATEVEVED